MPGRHRRVGRGWDGRRRTWSDKFCAAGQPAYAQSDEDGNPVYEDLYGVAGSQGSVDYDADPETAEFELGEVPYSCVWAPRALVNKLGYVDPQGNPAIQVYKAERLTSASRDALQMFLGGGGGAGFAIAWQEDPEGLRPGSGAGPGDGFSVPPSATRPTSGTAGSAGARASRGSTPTIG